VKRTPSQQASLEIYCREMANLLNDSGQSLQSVCTVPIYITQENFKENIVKPVMKALYPAKKSTTELNTQQISVLYEQVNLFMGEKFGVSMQFPSYFNEN